MSRRAPTWRERLRDGAFLVVGSLLYALALDCLMVPTGLAAGGTTGVSVVVNALTGLPVGAVNMVINVALLLWVARTRSRRYLARTLAGLVVSSVLIDVLAPFAPDLAGGDVLIAALVGGAVSGAGLGLVYRSGGNTGGVDIVAQALSRRMGYGVGSVTIVLDSLVVASSIPVFSLRNALYAVLCMFVSGRVCDAVVDGPRTARAAYVISREHERIAEEILTTLDRGCTELSARGLYAKEDRPVLFCVLGRSEVSELKAIVAEADPDAIVFISEVHEAFGEGFRRIEDDEA